MKRVLCKEMFRVRLGEFRSKAMLVRLQTLAKLVPIPTLAHNMILLSNEKSKTKYPNYHRLIEPARYLAA